MIHTMRARSPLTAVLLCSTLAACGASSGSAASLAPTPTSSPGSSSLPAPTTTPAASACALAVVAAQASIARRVYAEDAASTNERIDLSLVLRSAALRAAALARDPAAARTATQSLVNTGHVARLRLTVGGRVLADAGSGTALAPVSATLTDANGAPIGTVLVAVQGTSGYLMAAEGLTGDVSVRSGTRVLGGAAPTGATALPASGLVQVGGVTYAAASFPVRAFPTGTLHVDVARPLASTVTECARSPQTAVDDAFGYAVTRLYASESTGPALTAQARRVARDPGLLAAVAAHDPLAIRAAIVALLDEHIVRVRVVAPGLAPVDVGGPYVLGPITVPLRAGGRTIGSAEVSIQDVLGFVLLARRLVGVQIVVALPATPAVTPAEAELIASSSVRVGGYPVVLRAGKPPTMSTLADAPASLPAQGTVQIGGLAYSVFTLTATAFPSGPLPVSVLVPTSSG